MRNLFYGLLCFFVIFNVSSQENLTQEQSIKQIKQLVKVNSESLNTRQVQLLADGILPNRQHYPNETIAKLFLLLADTEINRGDVNAALDYTQQGLAVSTLNKQIKLCLLLKLAQIHVAEKNYSALLDVAERAVKSSESVAEDKYKLFALSYRSVALATSGRHQQALLDLEQVEQGIAGNTLFNEHIELFTILADAYYQLNDFQTVLTLQLNILKLRFEAEQKGNIERTYLSLGYAYIFLQRFDDAYNAFWEAKYFAEKKSAPINIAYAQKGVGISLLKQQEYSAAVVALQHAANIFQQENLHSNLIETLVALAKAQINAEQKVEGYTLLRKILMLLDGKPVSFEYLGFYRMLAAMHFDQGNYQNAYVWQKKHSELLLIKMKNKKKSANSVRDFYNQPLSILQSEESIIQSRELAVKLAQENQLSNSYSLKLQQKHSIIISLTVLVTLLLITLFVVVVKLKSKKRTLVYETEERPSYILASPMQTKHDYQLAFKKARTYQYPLLVSYFIIDNWQELIFLCGKKSIKEVRREIASVINEQLTEFDQAGLLNDGEYLLLFEHQSEEEVREKVIKLTQALSVRFFANLGNFSVTINYALKSPDFKDIDPYVFLARLCESVVPSKQTSKQANK